jgi:tetratricopeptide (TPR) repeat protein
MQRGDFAAAVDSFEVCTKYRGDWVEALVNLGLAYWKFQDLDGATQTFEKILGLQAQNSDALRALIAIAIERKDHNRAWDLHQQLTALGQRSLELSYNLGLLLQSVGEPDKAAQCYQLASEAEPDFPAALTNLGHALKASGRDDEARAAWSKAVEVDPELAAKYFQ